MSESDFVRVQAVMTPQPTVIDGLATVAEARLTMLERKASSSLTSAHHAIESQRFGPGVRSRRPRRVRVLLPVARENPSSSLRQ